MSLLPSKTKNPKETANNDIAIFKDLKTGNKQKIGDFIWSYLDRVYAITFLATTSHDIAEILTIQIFQQAFDGLNSMNIKDLNSTAWEWLSEYIVNACKFYHSENSGEVLSDEEDIEAFNEDLTTMDWETTIILGASRMKKCLATLSEEQQKVYLLRHKLELGYNDIAGVLNFSNEKAISLLYRARVQIVKCLGKG